MKAIFISNESLGSVLSERVQSLEDGGSKRERAVKVARCARLLRELELVDPIEEPYWIGWGVSHLGHVGAILVQGETAKIHAAAPDGIRVTDVTEEVMNEASSK